MKRPTEPPHSKWVRFGLSGAPIAFVITIVAISLTLAGKTTVFGALLLLALAWIGGIALFYYAEPVWGVPRKWRIISTVGAAALLGVALLCVAAFEGNSQGSTQTPLQTNRDFIGRKPKSSQPTDILAPTVPVVTYFPKLILSDYNNGENIDGIKWRPGYSHVVVSITNTSDITIDDYMAIISFDGKHIIAATVATEINQCNLSPTSPLANDVFIHRNGKIINLRGGRIYPDLHIHYTLFCPKLVSHTTQDVNFATVEFIPPPLESKNRPVWYKRTRSDPSMMFAQTEFVAYGQHEKRDYHLPLTQLGAK